MKRILIISSSHTLMLNIKAAIQGHPNEYAICGIADNSVLGMNLIESTNPDLVFMPVHMDFWSAEDLINHLMTKSHCPVFILLSLGEDVSNISTAASVKIGAVLPQKQFSEEDVLQSLNKAVQFQDNELPVPNNRLQNSNAIQHSLEVMELIMGLSPFQTQEAQQEYGRLRVGKRNCWLLLGSFQESQQEDFDFLQNMEVLENLLQSLSHLLRPLGACEVCIYQEKNLCILLEESQKEEPEWEPWLQKINLQLDLLGIPPLLFEISDTPLSLSQWRRQCRELLKLREIRFFYSPLYLQPKIKKAYAKFIPQSKLYDQLAALTQVLQSGNTRQFPAVLADIESSVSYSLSRDVYSYVVSQLVLQYHNCRSVLCVTPEAAGKEFRIRNYKSVRNFFADYREAVEQLFAALDSSGSKNSIIKEIYQYIQQNLSENLSLETLSKHVHVTPSYLSRLFKKDTGISLNTYISQKRIEKARNLLASAHRITDISGMVGFESSKYFSQVFKKETGQTPQEYRQSLQGGNEL